MASKQEQKHDEERKKEKNTYASIDKVKVGYGSNALYFKYLNILVYTYVWYLMK